MARGVRSGHRARATAASPSPARSRARWRNAGRSSPPIRAWRTCSSRTARRSPRRAVPAAGARRDAAAARDRRAGRALRRRDRRSDTPRACGRWARPIALDDLAAHVADVGTAAERPLPRRRRARGPAEQPGVHAVGDARARRTAGDRPRSARPGRGRARPRVRRRARGIAITTWPIPTRCACTRPRCSTTGTSPAWPTASATRSRPRPFPAIATAPATRSPWSTADADGWAVSLIQSLWDSFGSGILEPETGIVAHDRGGCFTLEPGHPNEIGPAEAAVPHADARARPP